MILEMSNKKTKSIKEDTSKYIPQREKFKDKLDIKVKFQLTEKQNKFLNLVLDKNTNIVFVKGDAGVAKSWTAILAA